MSRRSEAIQKARKDFMQNLKLHKCLTCKATTKLTPSHLFKVNSRYGADPTDLNLIVCQCVFCHSIYELLPVPKRVIYWNSKGYPEISNRMQSVIDKTYKRPE